MQYTLALSAEPISGTIDSRLHGVGMIRSEYLCRVCNEYIATERCRTFVRNYVSSICKLFYPAEVWYRNTDLFSPEVNAMPGADAILEEKHYLVGSRGIRRGMQYFDTFALELENISKVSQEYDNLNVLLSYIYDPQELSRSIQLLKEVRFRGKFGIMAEIPSTILLLEEFAAQGISNITVGTNDLTSLTLGTSRGEYLDHSHRSVIKLIEMAKATSKRYGIPLSVGGKVSTKLEGICRSIGVEFFVIHYSLLPEILHVPKEELQYLHYATEFRDKYV